MNKEVLEKYQIYPKKVRYKKKIQIIEDEQERKYVLKKNKKRKRDIYEYLEARNFHNFPKPYTNLYEPVELVEYIQDIEVDASQRIEDMVYLLSILHNKTTFYKEIDLHKIKEIYEEMMEQYDDILIYYQNIQRMIEEETYMSPANYYFIIQINKTYQVLTTGKNYLEMWYQAKSEKKTSRFVLNHNHLTPDHLLESQDFYLINWDYASIGFPTEDLENLIKENFQDIHISTILDLYNARYQLTKDEYDLLVAKLCLLKKIDFNQKESKKIEEVSHHSRYLQSMMDFLLEQNSRKPKQNQQ